MMLPDYIGSLCDCVCHGTGIPALYRATAAAGRARRVEESPAAAQVLPKRGEDWARSRADVQFMQEGHVYFTDSVCPTSGKTQQAHVLLHATSAC